MRGSFEIKIEVIRLTRPSLTDISKHVTAYMILAAHPYLPYVHDATESPSQGIPPTGSGGRNLKGTPSPLACPIHCDNGRRLTSPISLLLMCQAMARYRPDMSSLLASDPSLQIDMARVQVRGQARIGRSRAT